MAVTNFYVAHDGDPNGNGTLSNPRKLYPALHNFYYWFGIQGDLVLNVKRGGEYLHAITGAPTNLSKVVVQPYGDESLPVPDISGYKTIKSWANHAPNIWKTKISDPTTFLGYASIYTDKPYDSNVGFLNINGILHYNKKYSIQDLTSTYQFFSDTTSGSPTFGWLFMHSESQPDPNMVKVACDSTMFQLKANMEVNGIRVIGTGAHGFQGNNGESACNNIRVNDCASLEVGGSVLLGYGNGQTRYGNGIEFYGGSNNVTVDGFEATEIWDVAATTQSAGTYKDTFFKYFKVRKAAQAIELWSNSNMGYQNLRYQYFDTDDIGFNTGFSYRRQDGLDNNVGVPILQYGTQTPWATDAAVEFSTFRKSRNGLASWGTGGGGNFITRNNTILLEPGQPILANATGQKYDATWVNTEAGRAAFLAANPTKEVGTVWTLTTPPEEPPVDEPDEPTEPTDPTPPTPPAVFKLLIGKPVFITPPPTEEPPIEEPEEPAMRVTGDIMPYVVSFANNTGGQDYAWLQDGSLTAKGFHAPDSAKARGPIDENFYYIPQELDANALTIQLGDGEGSSDQPTTFAGLYENTDGTFTEVADIIPAFYGPGYNSFINSNVAPAHSKLRYLKMVVKMTAQNNPWSMLPSEMRIIADHKPFTRQPAPKTIVEFQNVVGAVTYPWNTVGGNNAPADPAKLAVKQAIRVERLYIDTEKCLEPDGTYGISPQTDGGWSIDELLRLNTLNGIHTIICLKGLERTADYVPILYNMAARWGDNPNIDPATLNIRTVKNDWRPVPEIKVGLGYNVSFQVSNEIDGSWKPTAFKPFEAADLHARAYAVIKSVSPNLKVVSNGFALREPGYIHAMNLWFKMYNKGVRAYDELATHYYCNEKGGQRAGAVGALPPEMTSYYADSKRLSQALFIDNPELPIRNGKTETGYSIQENLNPEQAVVPIGDKDVFEVQADLTMRTILEALRAGEAFVTIYQLYDDSSYINRQPDGPWTSWDTSNGIADRNTNDIHKRRPATDYMYQSLQYLTGYKMTTEADRTKEVFVDTFTKAGSPTIYSLVVPTYEGKVVLNYPLEVGNASSATIIRFVPGSDNASETTATVTNGILLVEASEAVTLVRVNN